MILLRIFKVYVVKRNRSSVQQVNKWKERSPKINSRKQYGLEDYREPGERGGAGSS